MVAVVLDDFGYPKTYITGVRQLQWQHPVADVTREKWTKSGKWFITSSAQRAKKRTNINGEMKPLRIFFALTSIHNFQFGMTKETHAQLYALPAWKKIVVEYVKILWSHEIHWKLKEWSIIIKELGIRWARKVFSLFRFHQLDIQQQQQSVSFYH